MVPKALTSLVGIAEGALTKLIASTELVWKAYGTPVFTRLSAMYLPSNDGLIKVAGSATEAGSPAFGNGLRIVTNYALRSDDVSILPWVNFDPATSCTATTITFGANNNSGRAQQTSAYIAKGQVIRISFTASVDSGTKNVRCMMHGLYSPDITITTTSRRYSYSVTGPGGTNLYMGVVNDTAGTVGTINISNVQFEVVSGQVNQNPSEYIPTTTVPITKFFAYANPFTVASNIVSDSGVFTPVGTQDGLMFEPVVTNKCVCWGVPRADALDPVGTSSTYLPGSEIVPTAGDRTFTTNTGWWTLVGFTMDTVNGWCVSTTTSATISRITMLTHGKTYKVVYTVANWTTGSVGINSNTTSDTGRLVAANGTHTFYFVANGTTPTTFSITATGVGTQILDVSLVEVFTDSITGLYPNTADFVSPPTLSIVTDATALATAGLKGICNGDKVYKFVNPSSTLGAVVNFSGIVGPANSHSAQIYARAEAVNAGNYMSFAGVNSSALTTGYTLVKLENKAYSYTNMLIRAAANQTVYFILPQVELATCCTSLIPAQGVLTSRVAQSLTVPTYGNLPAEATVTNTIDYSEDFSSGVWGKSAGTSVVGKNAITLSNIGDSIANSTSITAVNGVTKVLCSAKLSGVAGEKISFHYYSGGVGLYSTTFTLTATPTVYSHTFTANASGLVTVYFRRNTEDTAVNFVCDWYQAEDITANPAKGFTGYIPTTNVQPLSGCPALVTNHPGWTYKFTWKYSGYNAPLAGTIALMNILFSTYVDVNTSIYLGYNGACLTLVKRVNGVNEFVSVDLIAIAGTSYDVTIRMNPDYTMNLFVDSVKDASGTFDGTVWSTGIGAEMFPHPSGVINVIDSASTAIDILSPYAVPTTANTVVMGGSGAVGTQYYGLNTSQFKIGKPYRCYSNTSVVSGTALTLASVGSAAYVDSTASGVTADILVAQRVGCIVIWRTPNNAGDVWTINEFSIKQITNSTTTLQPIYGANFNIGGMGTTPQSILANATIKDVRVYKRALQDSEC